MKDIFYENAGFYVSMGIGILLIGYMYFLGRKYKNDTDYTFFEEDDWWKSTRG